MYKKTIITHDQFVKATRKVTRVWSPIPSNWVTILGRKKSKMQYFTHLSLSKYYPSLYLIHGRPILSYPETPIEIWPIYSYNYWPFWHCSFVKTWYLIISIMLPGKGKHKTPSYTTGLTLSIIQIQIQIYRQGESRTIPGCNWKRLHSSPLPLKPFDTIYSVFLLFIINLM